MDYKFVHIRVFSCSIDYGVGSAIKKLNTLI